MSTQVPANAVFLTDGPDKRVVVGNRTTAVTWRPCK
ncbi:MAG: DUF6088 family protein [Pirellula sp.]|nr:DUF6088 family protein [Pirellula sp.]